MAVFATGELRAQTINRITDNVDSAKPVALPNHHPQWANKDNSIGLLPSDHPVDHLTLVLSRSPQQEAALEKFLGDQQDHASPDYHHWLAPAEMGQRFGLSEHDIAALSGWLRSQGLHVNWVSPSRLFIGFGGTAGDVGRAFHTELHTYKPNGKSDNKANGGERMSVSSDPMVPLALAPAIKAVRGLYSIDERPLHFARAVRSDSPEFSPGGNNHYITPADFATIYDFVNGTATTAQTIGIVGGSRTNFADFSNFRQKTGSGFQNPTEIVPTAFGGVDPGPALTAPPTGNVSTALQLEATIDVTRAGSVASNAQLLLVVATPDSGGIETDAQYLVQTSPLPAQVMSVSFEGCESAAGPSGVAYWDTLFQQAAAEGISVFVASGDAGASGCDENFTTPPATPQPNSPNYLCSSSYATCVGGTELNDTANPSQYWSPSNDPYLGSALGYIPEGGWNEPLDSSSDPQVAASGGGVSHVIPTPTWQTGTGVPTAMAGRYTPDIAFSASGHDGYFACFAVDVGNCVDDANGGYEFEYVYGTSAAAPSMAGIAAILNSEAGVGQGNLNPQIYQMAASTPATFHDTTVASSGVTSCDVNTPSMCNNSIPGVAGLTGGQPGYLVTDGYDEVTGLGSLDVFTFFSNSKIPPTIIMQYRSLTFPSQLLGFSTVSGDDPGNSGSSTLEPLSIAITGTNASDFTETNGCQSSLTPHSQCSIQVTFAPSAVGPRSATMTVSSSNGVNSPVVVPLTGTGSTTPYVPDVIVSFSPDTITTIQALTVTVYVKPPSGAPPTPTGLVTLTSGGYTSAAATLVGGIATVNLPAGSLALGDDVLTASYTPDSASSSIFSSASGASDITVVTAPPPAFTLSGTALTVASGATTANTSLITITPSGGFTGSVALTAAITASPAGAVRPPTLSFGGTTPVNITATTTAGTATLTISTTASSTSALTEPATRIPWYAGGAASLACLLLLITPARLRRWRGILGIVLLLITFAGCTLACGGGSGSSAPTAVPGTAAGTYTITVTGSSGTTMATGTVIVTVN